MATLDVAALRAHALKHGRAADVTVNQRALVDKMLSRYCSDNVVIREMTQNADDAGASTVWLSFTTCSAPKASSDAGRSKRVAGAGGHHALCDSLHVTNDGREFTAQDWARLVRIAEGNVDSEAVGMFGVGYYSCFAHTEEPCVKSGDRHVVFLWRGNSLVTYAASSPHDPRTTVMMPFREPSEWDFDDIARFLARAVLFTSSIHTMVIRVDGADVFTVSKALDRSTKLRLPRLRQNWGGAGDAVPTAVPGGADEAASAPMFTPEAASVADMRVTVAEKWGAVKWGGGKTLATSNTTVVNCRMVSVTAGVNADAEFKRHTRRVLKKDLPPSVTARLLYPGDAETLSWAQVVATRGGKDAAHGSAAARKSKTWAGHILPVDPKTGATTGLVFVGLATHQTTGAAIHIHTKLVPTIERENIDFQDPQLRRWNAGLLAVTGVAARAFFDATVATTAASARSGAGAGAGAGAGSRRRRAKTSATAAVNGTSGALAAHAFVPSHPSPHVAAAMRAAFFRSPVKAPLVPTMQGLLPASDVILPTHGVEVLVAAVSAGVSSAPGGGGTTLPIARSGAVACAGPFFSALRKAGFGRLLTPADVSTLLANVVLPRAKLAQVLHWFCGHAEALFSSASDAASASAPQRRSRKGKGKGATTPGAGSGSDDRAVAAHFKAALRLVSWSDHDRSVRTMHKVKYYDATLAGAGGANGIALPCPATCLPADVAACLTRAQLKQLGLKPLPLREWLRSVLTNASRLAQSKDAARVTLAALSRRSGQFGAAEWTRVRKALRSVPCVPTTHVKQPMRRPEDAYLRSTAVPDHLPVVDMDVIGEAGARASGESDDGVVDLVESDVSDSDSDVAMGASTLFITADFATKLGVRTVPDTDVLLDNIKTGRASAGAEKAAARDNCVLVAQLLEARRAAGASGMPEATLAELKTSAILAAAGDAALFRPDQLYFQSAVDAAVAAGLPDALLSSVRVVQWRASEPLQPASEAGQFLAALGVRDRVGLHALATACATGDRSSWLFLVANFDRYRADLRTAAADLPPFLPCTAAGVGYSGAAAAAAKAGPPKRRCGTRGIRGLGKSSTDGNAAPTAAGGAGQPATTFCSPSQCFSQPNPFFPCLSAAAVADAVAAGVDLERDLGVKPHPTLTLCLAEVTASPPATRQRAEVVLGYLGSGFVSGATPSVLRKFTQLRFVPVDDGGRSHEAPANLFVVSHDDDSAVAVVGAANSDGRRKRRRGGAAVPPVATTVSSDTPAHVVYRGLATFVDFGEAANAFLKQCGAKDRPTPTQAAELIMAGCDAYLERGGTVERYMSVLRDLASGIGRVSPATLRRLKVAPCVVGYRLKPVTGASTSSGAGAGAGAGAGGTSGSGSGSGAGASSPTRLRTATLGLKASEVFLCDHQALEQQLRPYVVPYADEKLNALYAALGSKWLSDAVTEDTEPVGRQRSTARCARVQALFQQRLPLLVVNTRGDRVAGVRKDAERALSSLDVVESDAIRKTITFNGSRFEASGDSATCALKRESRSAVTLHLSAAASGTSGAAGDVTDWYDVADEVVNFLFVKREPHQVSHVAMVLSSPVDTLRRRGLLVDRLILESAVDVEVPHRHRGREAATDSAADARVGGGRQGAGVHQVVELGGEVLDFRAGESDQRSLLNAALRGGKQSKLDRIVTTGHTETRSDHQCEHIAASDLRRVNTVDGVPLFVDRGAEDHWPSHDEVTAASAEFAALLRELSAVIGIPRSCLHMYYDVASARVAFNSNGALFFNLRYYMQCHRDVALGLVSASGGKGGKGKGKRGRSPRGNKGVATCAGDVVTNWFVTMCHEAAHNVDSGHNAYHESAMELLLQSRTVELSAQLPRIMVDVWGL